MKNKIKRKNFKISIFLLLFILVSISFSSLFNCSSFYATGFNGLTPQFSNDTSSNSVDTSAIEQNQASIDQQAQMEEVSSDFMDTSWSGTISVLYKAFWTWVLGFLNDIQFNFSPGVATFCAYFGYTGASDILVNNYLTQQDSYSYVSTETTSGITEANKDLILSGSDAGSIARTSSIDSGVDVIFNMIFAFAIFAYALATVLFIFNLIKSAFAIGGEAAMTPFQIILKYVIVIISISAAEALLNPIMEIMANLYAYVYTTTSSTTMGTILGNFMATCSSSISGNSAITGGLVSIVMGTIVIIELLKLIIEIIERYLWSVLLYFLSPIAFAMIVAKETENVFTSYLVMFVSQLFLLVMNQVFIHTTLYMMSTFSANAVTAGVTGYLAVIAWLRIGQKMDENMRALGLSVSKTGGNILDSVLGAAGAVIGSMQAVRGVAGGVTSAAGKGIQAVGLKTGHVGAARVGGFMAGHSSTPSQIRNSMLSNDVMPKGGMTKGMISSISNGISPKDPSIASMVNSNADTGRQMMDSLFGGDSLNSIMGHNAKADSIMLDPHTGHIGVNGSISDPVTGTEYSNGITMSRDGKGLSNPIGTITDANGNEWQIQHSEQPSFNGIPNDSHIADMDTFASLSGMTQDDISSITGHDTNDIAAVDVNDGVAICFDADGKEIGSVIDNDDGTFDYRNTDDLVPIADTYKNAPTQEFAYQLSGAEKAFPSGAFDDEDIANNGSNSNSEISDDIYDVSGIFDEEEPMGRSYGPMGSDGRLINMSISDNARYAQEFMAQDDTGFLAYAETQQRQHIGGSDDGNNAFVQNYPLSKMVEERYGAVPTSVRFDPEDERIYYATRVSNNEVKQHSYSYENIGHEKISNSNKQNYFNAGKYGAILVHKNNAGKAVVEKDSSNDNAIFNVHTGPDHKHFG